ncbi:carbohydrate-binding protein [Microbacterium sp. NEAU-LLC]|uniref:Carbohydrate-binding protein n=1 Tax=Microbacterium helvum TaxID=2773713 RepID=A0ABR8NK96_9MICO|nr:carbohydrate-binding protein [Microbacterium helvum]MBD3941100.1 carbohydrate-binding protein [Microbacterium helvum]
MPFPTSSRRRRLRAGSLSACAAVAGALLLAPTTSSVAAAAPPPHLATGTYSSLTDGSVQWQPLPAAVVEKTKKNGKDASPSPVDETIVVDTSQSFQRYRGIGISIDETAVANLFQLSEAERRSVIEHLVSPTDGAGMDLFRIPIGSPDLIAHLPFWSYDDLPAGVTEDFGLEHFSIQRDIDLHIVETIKLIQEYNPDARFFGSAWSAPAWMTTSNTFTGFVEPNPNGSGFVQASRLRDDAIDVFARYYVKFIQAYGAQGIPIDAITLLNEPGMDVVYPAMDISIPQQQKLALAIKREFSAAELSTELWMHDFNFWDWRDPNSTETKNYYRVFEDAADGSITGAQVLDAADGIAFHPYWGSPSVMRDANRETGLPVHMTETSDVSLSTVLDYLHLNVDSYVMWAQITDQDGGTLHWTDKRDNNVDWDEVARTSKWKNRLVTAHIDTGTATYRETEISGFGQIARYLDTDDVRVQSSSPGDLDTAVFRDDKDVFTAIVQNTGAATTVRFALTGQSFTAEIPAASVATFQWRGKTPNGHDSAPTLAPLGDLSVAQNSTATVRLQASDRDGDRLLYYGTELPDGVSVDAQTGVVTITPSKAGLFTPTFTVTDGIESATVSLALVVEPAPVPIGTRLEAEDFVTQTGWADGAQMVESNASASGGRNVGWIATGNTLSFLIDVPVAGTYSLEVGVANGGGAAIADAVALTDAAGTTLGSVSVPVTGGWASFVPTRTTVTLGAGVQTVALLAVTSGFNLDYLVLTPAE